MAVVFHFSVRDRCAMFTQQASDDAKQTLSVCGNMFNWNPGGNNVFDGPINISALIDYAVRRSRLFVRRTFQRSDSGGAAIFRLRSSAVYMRVVFAIWQINRQHSLTIRYIS